MKFWPFWIISCIALIFSAISLYAIIHTSSLSAQYDISSVLTLLIGIIALLIGWQINQTITVLKEHKEMKDNYTQAIKVATKNIRDEMDETLEVSFKYMLLLHQNRSLDLVREAIFDISRSDYDSFQCRLSLNILVDLLSDTVNNEKDIEILAKRIDREWLHHVGIFIHGARLSNNDLMTLDTAITKLHNYLSKNGK